MSTVRRQGTRLEAAFAQGLAERGLTGFEEQPAGIPGRPDFAHRDAQIADLHRQLFLARLPAASAKSIEQHRLLAAEDRRNRARDRRVSAELKEAGWRVVRIWEHSVRNPRALRWWLTRIGHLVAAQAAS